MEPIETYHNGKKVKIIFNLLDKTKVDIALEDNSMLRNVDKSELMVRLVDAEIEINALKGMLTDIRKIIDSVKHMFY